MAKSADFLDQTEFIFRYGYELSIPAISENIIRFSDGVTLPKMQNSVSVVTYKNRTKTIAGKYNHSNINLNLKTCVEPNTAIQFWSWYRKVYPKPGIVGKPRDYKQLGKLFLVNGRGDPINTWTLMGCWPSSIDMGEARNDSTEIILMNMTIEVDDFIGPY